MLTQGHRQPIQVFFLLSVYPLPSFLAAFHSKLPIYAGCYPSTQQQSKSQTSRSLPHHYYHLRPLLLFSALRRLLGWEGPKRG